MKESFLHPAHSFPYNPVDCQEQRVATVQTISGTGALRVGAEFLSRFHNMTERTVLVSDPTYVNHFPVFGLNGFEVKQYRYYDNEQRTLDFEGMKEDIHNAPQVHCLDRMFRP